MNERRPLFNDPAQFLEDLDGEYGCWDPWRQIKDRLDETSLERCRRWLWTKGEDGSL